MSRECFHWTSRPESVRAERIRSSQYLIQKRERKNSHIHTAHKKPIRLSLLILVYKYFRCCFFVQCIGFRDRDTHIARNTHKNNRIHESETAMCCAHDKEPCAVCVPLFFNIFNTLSSQMATQHKKRFRQLQVQEKEQQNTFIYVHRSHSNTHTHTFIKNM